MTDSDPAQWHPVYRFITDQEKDSAYDLGRKAGDERKGVSASFEFLDVLLVPGDIEIN